MPNDSVPRKTNLQLKQELEALYLRWHKREFLGTDPIHLLQDFSDSADREVAGFLISCLALGRVSAIVSACKKLFLKIGSPLRDHLVEPPVGGWLKQVESLTYRFFSPSRIADFLDILGVLLTRFGSLEQAFLAGDDRISPIWNALDSFASHFHPPGRDVGILLPTPGRKSAFKRLNLFLRWMVRNDDIDLGLWSGISCERLLMPIDTHVLQWAQNTGLTDRKQADRKACEEVTAVLKEISPTDPLKYDFSITRAGILKKRL